MNCLGIEQDTTMKQIFIASDTPVSMTASPAMEKYLFCHFPLVGVIQGRMPETTRVDTEPLRFQGIR